MTINIKKVEDQVYRINVAEQSSATEHTVVARKEYIEGLGWEGSVESLLKKSFEFLLERESKEDILREFDLSVIQKYFPDYQKEIGVE